MITVSLAFLLIFPILHPHMTAAQPQSTNPAVCEYQEKRVPVPSNPETNEPYVPNQRNQEPFDGGSISKDEIRQCLQAKASIKNHHIVFDDYWQAWASLAKETRDYAIPLRIEGGVLHAPAYDEQANTGGIGLWKFRDPNVSSGSDLTEEERKAFRIKHQNTPIALIRSPVSWNAVLIDSAVIPYRKDRQNTNEIISIIFSAEANFSSSTFNAEANFSNSTFNAKSDFFSSTFNAESNFSSSTFDAKSDFIISIFDAKSDFTDSTFNAESSFYISTFNAEAIFIRSTFNAEANFSSSTFNEEAIFVVSTFNAEFYCSSSTFNAESNFHSSTFKAKADFRYTRFKNNTDFRHIKVNSDQLVFNNTAWEKRTDLRRMSVKDLQWDSTENPSDVKGTVDFRDALIGSATVKEVRFQDLVDFSRMTVGQYGERIEDSPPKAEREEQKVFWASHPLMHFENNTFENEADFLHIKLYGPIRLIRNRFRSTFDLTGTMFEAKQSGHPNPPAIKPHLCLSYNRIHRFVFESQHLDRVKSVEAPECQKPADSVNASDRLNQSPEPLPSLYKSLEKAFSDANDRKGVNEAWYLGVVAKRDQMDRDNHTIGSMIWAKTEWLFGDAPSRYAVDVWQTVGVSALIIIVFAVVYLVYFLFFDPVLERWHVANKKADTRPDKTRVVMIPAATERQRSFRLRLFESMHSKQEQHSRGIQPFRDAIALSVRAFTKLGMGTIYPNERILKWLTSLEWALGIFMLIHFILAMKNNLPFILPFLGVVN